MWNGGVTRGRGKEEETKARKKDGMHEVGRRRNKVLVLIGKFVILSINFINLQFVTKHLSTITKGVTIILSISIFLIISIFGISLSTKYNFHGSTSYLHQYEILKMTIE